jgi:MFS family permease
MLPPGLFRIRAFAASSATAFLMTAALMAAVFLTSQYLQGVLGHPPVQAGLRLLPWTATPLVIAPLAGALSDRIGTRPVLAAGMFLQGVGLAWFAVVATADAGYGRLVAPFLVAGVGISMALPTSATAALGAVPPTELGKASGANNTLQRFGGAFGIAVASAVFSAQGRLGSVAGFVAGYRPAVAAAAALSLAGTVTALAVGRRSAHRPVPVTSTVDEADTKVLAL